MYCYTELEYISKHMQLSDVWDRKSDSCNYVIKIRCFVTKNIIVYRLLTSRFCRFQIYRSVD